jgi:hypothetical protein
VGAQPHRWVSTSLKFSTMSFELILPFLRPIESLLLDDSISVVDFVVHIEGQPRPRHAICEVLRMIGYDREAKRLLVEPVFEVQHAA